MLKQIAVALLAALMAAPAMAQDAGEIARAQAGKDCRNCNLFQADLSYLDIPGIDLSRSRLRQADLSLATMNHANLAGANLSVANLFGSRLTGADLAGADLQQASLVGAYLGSANLAGAKLSGANLGGAELATAKGLTQAQLDTACGDAATELPSGLHIPACR
ncbi:MAG: pentapeptide repeat-containing protein [Hyphomonas sp.]|nr:pentapeptide repeat-containing protein [Hyphomonas sp.]